jgi:hypothetical protein
MITRFLTDVRVTFNPFSPRSKPARLFLSLIPPNARANGMKIESKMLPRDSKEPASLGVKFSTYAIWLLLWRGLDMPQANNYAQKTARRCSSI